MFLGDELPIAQYIKTVTVVEPVIPTLPEGQVLYAKYSTGGESDCIDRGGA